MSLQADFVVRRARHTTAISLAATDGEVIALVGPNGAGKSTALRALAGLTHPSSGRISVNGQIVASESVHVPAYQRDVGFVFQDHLLFPHLSVRDNVAFGLQARGRSKGEAAKVAERWLARLGIDQLGSRSPRSLSGGQAQRVAIARALAYDPFLLLLDEPTAALDAAGAMTLRADLRHHLDDFEGVAIVVTHNALDAMVLADRMVVLDEGSIVQEGRPADVAAQPKTAHVAALVGLNLLQGQARDGVITTADSVVLVAASRITGHVYAAFRPAAVGLFTRAPEGSPRNVWRCRIVSVAPHGDVVRVQLDAGFPLLSDVTPQALAALDLRPGREVWASVKATEVTVYSA